MLIGLIADTHIPEAGPDLWPQVYNRFREMQVEAILHAGDIHILPVLDRLEQRVGVPVFACRGNGDDGGAGRPVVPDDPRLRPDWVIEWLGYRIGLTHFAEEAPPYRPLEAQMERHFGGHCDIVVYGDTHVPHVELIRNTLLVNPGSPMYPRNMNTSLGTIGYLRLTESEAEAWVEPLHPADGPALRDNGILHHTELAARHPDQWVMFAVHGHDPLTGRSHGSVVHAGFPPEQGPALERRIRYREPSAILLTFHTSELPARGIGQRLMRGR